MSADRTIARTLLIDADDTLWENNIYYLRCTEQFLVLMQQQGISRELAQRSLDACEHELIPTLGYGPYCYQAALGITCESLLTEKNGAAEEALVQQARACAELALQPPTELLPLVRETLAMLRPSSRLVLVTKGLPEVQEPKLMRSGLAPLFDRVHIVPEKGVDTYRDLLMDLGAPADRTWMIGNSPRSDINPAIAAGIGGILIPHDHTWTAEHEELDHPERVTVLPNFADLITFFQVADQEHN